MTDSYPPEEKYDPGYCSECGEKNVPPISGLDICPYCHPNTEYERGEE